MTNTATINTATINTVTINKADIISGGMKSYKQDDDSIILITRDEDEFSAFDGKCPHAGADLGTGLRCGNRVICPWHHATFDSRDGTLLEPLATEGLTQYQITDNGDSLTVDTSAKIDKQVKNDKLTDTHTIIVGGGGAGFMTAHQLRNTGYGGKITLVSAEDKAPYNRPLLSKAFLAGNMPEEKLLLGGADWANKHDIALHLNQTVSEVISNERTIVMTDNDGNEDRQTADFLVVATGAEPKIPPIKGATLDGVYTLRSMEDAKLIKAASHDQRVVIVGTGFIGMEVASALAQSGTTASITVIGQDHRVMGNIVSEVVSNALIKLHKEKGVQFVFDASVAEIMAAENNTTNNEDNFSQVCGVKLANGEQIDADIVILGTGVAPRIELLQDTNHPDGVQVDEHSLAERIPFFWTMQYGKSLRYSGHAATPEYGILLGSPDTFNYIEYYFDDEGENTRASAASSLGRDKELVAFSELLRNAGAD